MNLFNWFKQLFKKRLIEQDNVVEDEFNSFQGDYTEFVNISAISFLDEELVQSIYQDLIVLIVNSDFIIDPPKILAFFKRHYKFTDSEFFILAFKLGMITKMYVHEPVMLIKSAIRLDHIFSPEQIKNLEAVLDTQVRYNKTAFIKEHKLFETQEKEKEFKKKLDAKDPDAMIDDWLQKNKKK